MSQFGYLLKYKSHFEYGLKEDPDPITTYAVKNENVQEEKSNKFVKKKPGILFLNLEILSQKC